MAKQGSKRSAGKSLRRKAQAEKRARKREAAYLKGGGASKYALKVKRRLALARRMETLARKDRIAESMTPAVASSPVTESTSPAVGGAESTSLFVGVAVPAVGTTAIESTAGEGARAESTSLFVGSTGSDVDMAIESAGREVE